MSGETLVAAISVVVTVTLGIFFGLPQLEALQRQRERENEEKRRAREAHLVPQFVRGYRRSDDLHLAVENHGQSSARKIRVRIDGKPAHQADWIIEEEEIFGPLASRHTLLIRAVPYDGMPASREVDIAWEDDSGEARRWNGSVRQR